MRNWLSRLQMSGLPRGSERSRWLVGPPHPGTVVANGVLGKQLVLW